MARACTRAQSVIPRTHVPICLHGSVIPRTHILIPPCACTGVSLSLHREQQGQRELIAGSL